MKASELEFVAIGQILTLWGTQGKLKVRVLTDLTERFTAASTVYIKRQPITINQSEWHKGNVILKLNDIGSVTAAQNLIGQLVEIPVSQLKSLPKGQYYNFQLIGLEVWTTKEQLLGKVTEVINLESNDIYVVQSELEEILIPAIEDVVKSIDLDEGHIVIEPIAGLLTLNRKRG